MRVLAFGLALALLPAAARAQDAAERDTTLLSHAQQMAQAKYAQLAGGAAADGGARFYANGQHSLASGDLQDAMLQITAALSRAPRNPLYRGDLGFLVARTGAFDSAATLLNQAYTLQQQNAWYLVGLAVVRAAQARWTDAAGTLEVAAQTDSSIVDARIASTATAFFTQAGDDRRALDWARIAVQRDSTDAASWFRLARAYAERNDTAGMAAARRYHRLRPDEPFGKLILAHMMFLTGKADSALVLAAEVSADTAYRDPSAAMYLRVGQRLLARRSVDSALAALTRGRALGAASLAPQFAYYIGRAQLVKVSDTLAVIEQTHDCAQARAAESLVVDAERNLREGVAVDTARANLMLAQVVPSYRTNAQNFRESFCRAQPARPQTRPRPRP